MLRLCIARLKVANAGLLEEVLASTSRGAVPPLTVVEQLLRDAAAAFRELPNFVPIELPEDEMITVCGDTHGQLLATQEIFRINGTPSSTNRYLFNGDFVDRGPNSVELALTLIAYKMMYPKSFFLSRGNHESASMNTYFGFLEEVLRKIKERRCYFLFQEVFKALPIGHIIPGLKVLVVHGGLPVSPVCEISSALQLLPRHRKLHPTLREMLWGDPSPLPGINFNEQRLGGHVFGPDVTERWLAANDLQLLVRSHESCGGTAGYREDHGGKCLTVFSAPNYDRRHHDAAFLKFSGADTHPSIVHFNVPERAGKGSTGLLRWR